MTSIFERVAEDLHIHHQDAAPAAAATPKENRVPGLAEAATAITALAGNPLVAAIAEQGIGKLLTPAEITFVIGMIASFEHERASAPQPPAPTGPQHTMPVAPTPTTVQPVA